MIEVEIPNDICKYETKFIGPFTTRQTICVAAALITVFPAYLFLSQYFIQKVALILCMVASTPFILCGFVKPYDMPFEKYAVIIFNTLFRYPAKRKYMTVNLFEALFDEDDGNKSEKVPDKKNKEKTNKKTYSTKIKQVSSDPDLFCCS